MLVTPDPYILFNYKVAHELNLTIPESLLGKANEIIR